MRNARPARRHLRAPYFVNVDLWLKRCSTPVQATDLSVGGVYLKTRVALRAGAFVTLSLSLIESPKLTALCRVARREPLRGGWLAGLGLAFIDVSPRLLERIDAYVQGTTGRIHLPQ